MKVIIINNIDMTHRIVNIIPSMLENVTYSINNNRKHITICVYIWVSKYGLGSPKLDSDTVPMFSLKKSLQYTSFSDEKYHIQLEQLLLLPVYAYTNYKSQGRSLKHDIVDLARCRSLQSIYVMLF